MRDRQTYDPGQLAEILADGYIAHVGMVRDGLPVVLPYIYAIGDIGDLGDGPRLLLHGSTGGGAFVQAGAEGMPVAVTITHLDGLVYARSTHDSSANYRSAMVFGRATPVPAEQRAEALWVVADHIMPGRRAEVREMTTKEIAATQVLQLPLDTVSVKVRHHGPGEAVDDGENHNVWAGVLPLSIRAGLPQTSELTASVEVSPSVLAVAAKLASKAHDREKQPIKISTSSNASTNPTNRD
ncbi:MAG: pyridoxamine 5'-phosphate oxidase family protein [Leifsonia sp.]